jgi:hypothetical protein
MVVVLAVFNFNSKFSHYPLIEKWRNEHPTPLFSRSEVKDIGKTWT